MLELVKEHSGYDASDLDLTELWHFANSINWKSLRSWYWQIDRPAL